MIAGGAGIVVAFVTLITLHRSDGEEVHIVPRHITAVTPSHDHGHFAPGVHCVIHQVDRKFVAVRETCKEVNHLLKRRLA